MNYNGPPAARFLFHDGALVFYRFTAPCHGRVQRRDLRIFQYKIFSRWGYFSGKYSASKDISVQNTQSVGIFWYTIFSQWGYFSGKYSVSKDISVQNTQSVGIFWYKIFSQWGYFSGKYSVSKDISVQNTQ
jgi:uncharacterized protein YjdB